MINGFDYSKYLREKKIIGIVKLEKLYLIGRQKDFKYYLFKFKEICLKRLDNQYAQKESGFLKAILLGYTNSLDEEMKDNFRNASISHIFAISGMHISYIILGLEIIFKKIIKNIKIRNIVIIVFLIIFSIFVGASNSIFRACIMNIIIYFGKTMLRKDNFFTSFKVALCILLIMNPYNIFSSSMWLSFGGSLGIVLYSKFIEKIALKKIQKIFKNEAKEISFLSIIQNMFKNIKEKAISIISVSIGAQVVLFPIIIYIFNTFSLNFLISNLLISELVGPIIILGYASFLIPFISIIEKILIKIILFFVKIIGGFQLNQILISTPKLYKIIIYYIILGTITIIFNNRKIWITRKIKRLGIPKTVFITVLIISFLFGSISLPFRSNFEIHFLDVGQGDSCLIRTTSNKVILIDGGKGINGEYDYGKNVIGPYLLDHGITKIDYVIVSHYDSDHCGGLFYILENFKVNNIIIGKQYSEYVNLMSFLNIQKAKKINLIVVESGSNLNFDKYTNAKVFFPNTKNKIYENEINNNSLVFKLYYKNISMLFTGDIEEEAERVLIDLYGENLKSDILKVGHHGSKTSSTREFINFVRPKIALIGVGKNNNFGHPDEDVVCLLESTGSKVYRTDNMGEIIININKNGKFKIKRLIDKNS